VQEVQRQTESLEPLTAEMIASMRAARTSSAPVAAAPLASERPAAAASAPASAPHDESAQHEESAPHDRTAPNGGSAPATTGPRTHPIILPDVDVAELGVADRLGLSDSGDDQEVGPTS
jgi:cell division transport system ATP-binding protein